MLGLPVLGTWTKKKDDFLEPWSRKHAQLRGPNPVCTLQVTPPRQISEISKQNEWTTWKGLFSFSKRRKGRKANERRSSTRSVPTPRARQISAPLPQWSPQQSMRKRNMLIWSDPSLNVSTKSSSYADLDKKFRWDVSPNRREACYRQSPSMDQRSMSPASRGENHQRESIDVEILADYFAYPLIATQFGRGHLLATQTSGKLEIRLGFGMAYMWPSQLKAPQRNSRLSSEHLQEANGNRLRATLTEPIGLERGSEGYRPPGMLEYTAVDVASTHFRTSRLRQKLKQKIRIIRRLQRRLRNRVPRQELLYMSSKAVVLQEYQALFQLLDGHTCAVKKDKHDITGTWNAGDKQAIHLEQHSDHSITGEYVTNYMGQEKRIAVYGSYKGRQLALHRADGGLIKEHRQSFHTETEIYGSAESNIPYPDLAGTNFEIPWQSARGRIGPYGLSGRLYFTHPTFHGGHVFVRNIAKAERKIVLRICAGKRLLRLAVPENCSVNHLKFMLAVRLGLSERHMRHINLSYRGHLLTNERPEFYRLFVTDDKKNEEVGDENFAKIHVETACVRMLKKIIQHHRMQHSPPIQPDDDMKYDDMAMKYDEQTRKFRKESFFTLANNSQTIVLKDSLRITFDQSLNSIRHYSRRHRRSSPHDHTDGVVWIPEEPSGSRSSSSDPLKGIAWKRSPSASPSRGSQSPGGRRSTGSESQRKLSLQKLRKTSSNLPSSSNGSTPSTTPGESGEDSENPGGLQQPKNWTVRFQNIATDKIAVMLFMENVNLVTGKQREKGGLRLARSPQTYLMVSPNAKHHQKLMFTPPPVGSGKKKHKLTLYIFKRHEANVSTSCAYGRVANNANLYNTPKSLGLETGDELFCHWWKLGTLVATCRSQGLRDNCHVSVVTPQDKFTKAFNKRAKLDQIKVYVTHENVATPIKISRHNICHDLLEAALKVYGITLDGRPHHLKLGRKKLDPYKELGFYDITQGTHVSLTTNAAPPSFPLREIELPSKATVSLSALRDYSPVESYCCENILKCSITFTQDNIDAKIESIIYDEDFA